MAVWLGVDVGGTFTDLVAVGDDGRMIFGKVPSVPADPSEAVLDAVRGAGLAGPLAGPGSGRGGAAGAVERFAHGTTVATNALLERRGARTALVTTHGFADIIEIGRQNRPALYDLTRDRPPPLVPRELRYTVVERTGPDGVIVPLDANSLRDVVAALTALSAVAEAGGTPAVARAGGVVRPLAAVAVCLLFSFAHPEHERQVADALRAALPGVTVVASHEVLPRFREYERFATTVADAYLTPTLSTYLGALARRCAAAGLPSPLVMRSSGGVVELAIAAEHAAACVLSGPAGGVVGAAYVAARSGLADLLTFDMGGTSTDVAPVIGGRVQTTAEAVLAGIPVTLPTVDVHSVSAGGGSVAWVDSGGALRAGPRSAGADPGPACYGRGGVEPTVTDADLVLGYLADGASLGGEVTLSRAAAFKALAALGALLGSGPHGLSVEETAAGVVAVADAEMIRALRVVSVERGLDPRELTLVAFGGAGGTHACALAEDLGMRRVLVPLACGVLSALGLAIGDVRRDYLRPLHSPLATAGLDAAFTELTRAAHADTPAADVPALVIEHQVDCRYVGQSHELTVVATADGGGAGGGFSVARIRAAFEAEHLRRYGHTAPDREVEVVAVRLVATVPGRRPELRAPAADPTAARTRRPIYLDGSWREVDVVPRAALGPGDTVTGPAVVEFPEATCLIRPTWHAQVDPAGSLLLTRVH
ncbi:MULTISPECIES: hydantoinase/oxoprolinase family protein [Protofrankia]|uniref:Hydantoinase n=1 Tax=Protofrankia coriariae TaxID=1562887 RepID=A0ABR5F4Z6_9ACTN|nr:MULTISPECIES: hydantoinase/oxoprolinase family protein [Protofrankia]KLL11722.1 hydantoinase [Protofrankia coriariae]ONH38431.1 hydantoinase [Protofrankia sp. BMG5.30]